MGNSIFPSDSMIQSVKSTLFKAAKPNEIFDPMNKSSSTFDYSGTFTLGPSAGKVEAKPSGGLFGAKPSGGLFGSKPSGGLYEAKPSEGIFGTKLSDATLAKTDTVPLLFQNETTSFQTLVKSSPFSNNS